MTEPLGGQSLDVLARDLWGTIIEPFVITDATVYERGGGRRKITLVANAETVGTLAEYIDAGRGDRTWAFTPNGTLPYRSIAAVIPALLSQGVRIDEPAGHPDLEDLPF